MVLPAGALTHSITFGYVVMPQDCLRMAKILEFSRLAFEAARWEKKNPPPQDWKGWAYYQLTNMFVGSFDSLARSAHDQLSFLPEGLRQQVDRRKVKIPSDSSRGDLQAFDDLLEVAFAVEDFVGDLFDSLEPDQKRVAREKVPPGSAHARCFSIQSAKRRRVTFKCDPLDLLQQMAELPTFRDRILSEVDAWCRRPDSRFQASQKVRNAIAAFLSNESQSRLDLSCCGLCSLPPVFHYPPFPEKLRQLNLESNLFVEMPATLGHLKNLEWLSFHKNALRELAGWMVTLPLLEVLDFSKNALRSLPSSFKEISGLLVADFSDNHLIGFPKELCELPNLCSVNLANNPDLTSLPPEVLHISGSCEIDLWGCGLSRRIVEDLRDAMDIPDYRGPILLFTFEEGAPYKDFPIEESLDLLYKIVRRKPRRFPDLIQDPISEGHLRRWLSRLIDMADFDRSGEHQRALAEHVVSYLELAQKDLAFRAVFFSLIKRAGETCGDRMALSVLHIGLAHKIVTFDKSKMKAFSELLIRGVFVVDLLERLARERIALEKKTTLRYVDEIEVYLGYPVMLKGKLKIPIDVDAMLFFRSSILTQNDLNHAERYVKEKLADQKTCLKFLIEQPEWREALKAKYPEGYAAMEEKVDGLLDAAYDDPSKMPEVEMTRERLFSELTLLAVQ